MRVIISLCLILVTCFTKAQTNDKVISYWFLLNNWERVNQLDIGILSINVEDEIITWIRKGNNLEKLEYLSSFDNLISLELQINIQNIDNVSYLDTFLSAFTQAFNNGNFKNINLEIVSFSEKCPKPKLAKLKYDKVQSLSLRGDINVNYMVHLCTKAGPQENIKSLHLEGLINKQLYLAPVSFPNLESLEIFSKMPITLSDNLDSFNHLKKFTELSGIRNDLQSIYRCDSLSDLMIITKSRTIDDLSKLKNLQRLGIQTETSRRIKFTTGFNELNKLKVIYVSRVKSLGDLDSINSLDSFSTIIDPLNKKQINTLTGIDSIGFLMISGRTNLSHLELLAESEIQIGTLNLLFYNQSTTERTNIINKVRRLFPKIKIEHN